jgi:hypothetical protein
MSAKHTPTPWHLTNDEIRSECTRDRFVASCEFIDFIKGDDDTAENLANAAFIVRAANNHDALVEIARTMAAEMTADSTGDMIRYGQAVDRARALLLAFDAGGL